jgi:hypothetical protein
MKSAGALLSLGLIALSWGCGEDEPAPCDSSVPGNICTIAGNGENGYDVNADSTPLPGLEARMSLPQDMLVGPDGTLYILDWNNHRLRRLTQAGMLEWMAGRGELGGSLDDPANNDFNHPPNFILDGTGDNIVIAAWHNSKVRTISLDTGLIVDTCGDGKRAYFGDGGPAVDSSLDLPASVALDPQGQLVIMDQANQVLRVVDSSGVVQRLAGNCIIDGDGPCAEGVEPVQCPDGPNGPSGKRTCGDPMATCSKPCTPGYSGDGIAAVDMRISQPFGQSAWPAGRIAFDPTGNLYFADTSNHIIRMIDTQGMVHRIAGTPPPNSPCSGSACEIQRGYAGDGGPALDAMLDFPVDLEIGEDGTVYFTDVYNHCVRAISPDGIVNTVVGNCGHKGFDGDGGPATAAHLKMPFGIELAGGRLYIADTGNNVIRSVLLP